MAQAWASLLSSSFTTQDFRNSCEVSSDLSGGEPENDEGSMVQFHWGHGGPEFFTLQVGTFSAKRKELC